MFQVPGWGCPTSNLKDSYDIIAAFSCWQDIGNNHYTWVACTTWEIVALLMYTLENYYIRPWEYHLQASLWWGYVSSQVGYIHIFCTSFSLGIGQTIQRYVIYLF